ncbi:MAG: hypothetical protein U5K56_09685 [Halioglobus sp.]|nr:hypothetical protein [Halioglobus sp.]
MDGELDRRLNLPLQELTTFSRFRPNPQAARDWTHTLPVTRSQVVAQELAGTLAELNRVRLSAENRYALLEVLQPVLESALSNLGKRFLNQPIVMPEEPQRMADLAAQVRTLMATAYALVAVHAIREQDAVRETHPAQLACLAIQRALLHTGRKVLQALQLYRPLEIHGWQMHHQLYALAEKQGLTTREIPRQLGTGATIHSTYLQALLLSCSKPNQLRQSDMAAIFHAMADWAEMVSLNAPDGGGGLFVVDLNSDQPPLYSSLYKHSASESCRYIHTADLIEHLAGLQNEGIPDSGRSQGREPLPVHLPDHLIDALGKMSMRNFKRTRSDAPLRVCVGLSSTHYHAADQTPFDDFLENSSHARSASENPFLSETAGDSRERSPADTPSGFRGNEWLPGQSAAGDSEHTTREPDPATPLESVEEIDVHLPPDARYPVFDVRLADASPGGYCMEWTEQLPDNLRTGDIVGLMEEHSRDWVIASIRWLSYLQRARTLIGLELVSPRATPVGALIHFSDGGKAPPMRALLLPEIKLIGQPQTLVTPRVSFHERQRITLVAPDETHTVQLLQQVASTASYAQFELRFTNELGDVLAREHGGPLATPYDSIWSHI